MFSYLTSLSTDSISNTKQLKALALKGQPFFFSAQVKKFRRQGQGHRAPSETFREIFSAIDHCSSFHRAQSRRSGGWQWEGREIRSSKPVHLGPVCVGGWSLLHLSRAFVTSPTGRAAFLIGVMEVVFLLLLLFGKNIDGCYSVKLQSSTWVTHREKYHFHLLQRCTG